MRTKRTKFRQTLFGEFRDSLVHLVLREGERINQHIRRIMNKLATHLRQLGSEYAKRAVKINRYNRIYYEHACYQSSHRLQIQPTQLRYESTNLLEFQSDHALKRRESQENFIMKPSAINYPEK
jgi:hypothetical protein